MTANIPTHFVQQYSSNIELLLQQKGSKLRGSVMEDTHFGKQATPVDQFGEIEAQKVTNRFGSMNRIDAPTDRRWVLPVDYDLPQLIDKFDKLRLLTNPESAYVVNATYAMGRAMDDEIIDAFFGTAKTGEDGSTDTTFPSAQQVAATVGAASATGHNVAKLRAAKKILMANEVDIEMDTLYNAISAEQHDDLLNETQTVSLDFNTRPVLVDGKITGFMGFNFIHTERLAVNGSSQRRSPAWAKSGMHLGVWGEVETDISQRKDLRGLPWQAYCYGTYGATRIEEGKIVELPCAE